MGKYKSLKTCRICNSKKLITYIDLGNQPLSNSFLKKNDISKEKKFPLSVKLCSKCSLSQLSIVPDVKGIYNNYDYLSSSSKALRIHYKKLVEKLINKFNVKPTDTVIDIGCNDGILINNYPSKFKHIIGVEPSKVIKKIKNKKMKLYNNFFNLKLSKKLKEEINCPKIITITNVFAHVDKLHDFIAGLSNIINSKSVVVIEVPYLVHMIENGYFDLIYHEHLSYITLTSVKKLLKNTKLRLFDFEKINFGASGPSLRIFITKKSYSKKVSIKVKKQIEFEKRWGINKIKKYKNFRNKVNTNIIKMNKILMKIDKKGLSIGCFTAPAKGNTLLNSLNLPKGLIKFVCENNKSKIGKFTPGTHIKVISDKDFLKQNIDFAILLSWNYKNFFIQNSSFSKNGGRFIVPFPHPKIIKK